MEKLPNLPLGIGNIALQQLRSGFMSHYSNFENKKLLKLVI
jgi:hypothetical protein